MSLRLPAIKCSSTASANVYQTALRIHDLVPYLLNGHDPRSQNWKNLPTEIREMYEKLQRKTNPNRRNAMAKYIERRMAPGGFWIGAVPPIVVGIRLEQPFVAQGDDDEAVGYLKVQTRLDRPNILLDGLGRVTGYLDTMNSEDLDNATRTWAGEAVLPIMLVTPLEGEELSLDQLGQLFHDMNTLATPVGKGQAVDLDKSDPYIQTTSKVSQLAVIAGQGGSDDRAISISKKSDVWTTKTVLLKAVRAAAEGPGSHVDHIRDEIANAFLQGGKEQDIIVDRFDDILSAFVDALPQSTVPAAQTLLRTSTWWVAFGLVLHDLYASYDEGRLSDEVREALVRRMAAIDWGLGNPDFTFLGSSVEEKQTGRRPVDSSGRPIINRFFGGSKAYYNLAAYIRQSIGLKDKVKYGSDYGASIGFDNTGKVLVAAE
jgi:hypothetical protein